MTKLKGLTKILLPLAVALLAAAVAYHFIPASATQRPIRLSSWLVAEAPISAGSVITAGQVGIQTGPASLAAPEDLVSPAQAVGQVALANFVPGEKVRRGDVQPPSRVGLEYVIPAGKRAMTISVSQTSGVDGRLALNERVDVLAVPNAALSTPGVVLAGLRILALGPPSPQTAYTNLGTGSNGGLYSTVTFSVTITQAETLAAAEKKGTVILLAKRQ